LLPEVRWLTEISVRKILTYMCSPSYLCCRFYGMPPSEMKVFLVLPGRSILKYY
jgi:hypothetical protein